MVNIFFHSKDMDGFCGGAITRFYYETLCSKEVKMFPIDYHEKFPIDEIDEGETVIFVDYNINNIKLIKKLNKNYNLIIIDHHISFINLINEIKINGIQSKYFSGCELAWKYLLPNRKMPLTVNLLGRYDVWDNSDSKKWENEIYPFQLGVKNENLDPSTDEGIKNWVKYFNNDLQVPNIINLGLSIFNYQKYLYKDIMRYSFDSIFMGYKVICCNSAISNSNLFNSKIIDHDIMFRFNRVANLYTVSLYTTKENIDCSIIAKEFGGGGHRKVSGFSCKDIKFNKEIEIIKI